MSGHVREIKHMKTATGHFVLKSDVTPSFRQTADPHKPWICLDVNGDVLTAHCNCMAVYDKLIYF